MMLPMVSSRAPPTGHLFISSLAAFLCNQKSRTLLPMSKTESMAVARRDNEPAVIAAYTAFELGGHLLWFRYGLTLQHAQYNVRYQTCIHRDFDLINESAMIDIVTPVLAESRAASSSAFASSVCSSMGFKRSRMS